MIAPVDGSDRAADERLRGTGGSHTIREHPALPPSLLRDSLRASLLAPPVHQARHREFLPRLQASSDHHPAQPLLRGTFPVSASPEPVCNHSSFSSSYPPAVAQSSQGIVQLRPGHPPAPTRPALAAGLLGQAGPCKSRMLGQVRRG